MEQYFPFILIALFAVRAVRAARPAAQADAGPGAGPAGVPGHRHAGDDHQRLHGTVAGLGDKTVDLEIAPGVVVTFARQAILEVRKPVGDRPDGVTDDGTPGTTGGRPADGTL